MGCGWQGLWVSGAPGVGGFERRGLLETRGGGSGWWRLQEARGSGRQGVAGGVGDGRRRFWEAGAPGDGGSEQQGSRRCGGRELRAAGASGAVASIDGTSGGRGAPSGCLAKAKANFFPYGIDFPQGTATCWFFNGKTFIDALFEKNDKEKKGSPTGGKSEILESFDTPSTPIPSFEYK
ncbi:hypothetical protein GUJ93_ZPchr0009g1843 [Zizania palustris]|uniref:Uncharacterized protein n=1 Tax=Zizania palustris TaxID=103762 RepID=A0A8J5V5R9_ZIZPA|nr:hypothetical protein GUJ93_ZPchr0009g1843 [Zizania palustris]